MKVVGTAGQQTIGAENMSDPFRLTAPGIYDLALSAYVADPAPAPSLSAGIAHALLERSPWHAYSKHPRLGGEPQVYRRDASIGTVFHALFLGKGDEYVVIDADDFRSKVAKEARDVALFNGQTPVLASDIARIEAMVEATAKQLAAHDIGDFRERPGKAEQTMLWTEGNVWCRGCIDWMPDDVDDEGAIYNIKTSTVAHPDVWSRRVFDTGYDLSAAHYTRGIYRLLGHEVIERFVVVETKPPYALSVIDLAPSALSMAGQRLAAAVEMWGACLANNRWPGYPRHIATIDLPPYVESRQIDREMRGRYRPEMLEDLIEGFAP